MADSVMKLEAELPVGPLNRVIPWVLGQAHNRDMVSRLGRASGGFCCITVWHTVPVAGPAE